MPVLTLLGWAVSINHSHYWLWDEKIPLQKIDGKYFVVFDSANEKALENELSKTGTALNNIEKVSDYSQAVAIKSFDTEKLASFKTATIEGDYEKIKSALFLSSYWGHYYNTEEYSDVWADFKFSVKLKSEADYPLLEKMAEENGVKIIEYDDFIDVYRLSCTNDSKGIVPQASSNFKVAVIDTGVQYGHPDLYNVLPGWDAENQSSPNIVSNSHGTEVAGLIGAIPNNGEAAAGIAHGVTILPISFRANLDGTRILSGHDVIARAVGRAVSEGAKVINCSWKTGSSPDVITALQNALTSGCIVVFASANDGGAISTIARSDPRILVVGAISPNGNRASFSNYGDALDVVAPGEGFASTTVGNGYAFAGLAGTSFAAPQVAAIAALILSRHPTFTRQDVTDIIEKSARKVGGYGYATTPGRPNGT